MTCLCLDSKVTVRIHAIKIKNVCDDGFCIIGDYWPLWTMFHNLISGWLSWLVSWKEKGFDSTKFYDSNGFLTSIFPNNSSEARTKIIRYTLCFHHNTWLRDNERAEWHPKIHCVMCFWKGVCIFIFCWKEESQIYTWICLPFDSFVSPRRVFFSQDSCHCVWGV